MNTNSTFTIGKDHIVCEDYAIADKFLTMGYAIVCDGCSASPEVDFGARVMAMSAKRTLQKYGTEMDANLFGEMTISNAFKVYEVFPSLHDQALDATLLVAMVKDNKLTAYMYGDGVLIHRNKTGISTVHISLSSGAPDYLAYHLDPLRKKAYDSVADNKKQVACTVNGHTIQVNAKPLEPYVMSCDVNEGDVIAVISDGINSFRKSDSTPIPWTDLIDEFTGFKTFEGEFVLRRISAFKRKCLKEGITHSDDISIAAIHV
jgi:hypothetical protein